MPPSKRKTVRRKSEATAIDNANDALDSSPSARSAKKRKVGEDLSTITLLNTNSV